MVYKQKLTKIGNSYGITIPKELREKLNLKPETEVYLTIKEGTKALTVSDKPIDENKISPEFHRLAKQVVQEYSKALDELAKK